MAAKGEIVSSLVYSRFGCVFRGSVVVLILLLLFELLLFSGLVVYESGFWEGLLSVYVNKNFEVLGE